MLADIVTTPLGEGPSLPKFLENNGFTHPPPFSGCTPKFYVVAHCFFGLAYQHLLIYLMAQIYRFYM